MVKFAASGNSTVTIDDSLFAAQDLSAHATAFDLSFVRPAIDVTALADLAERVLADIQRHPEFSIDFFWDNTATTGSWTVIKGIIGLIGTVTIFPDGTLGLSGEALCVSAAPAARVSEAVVFTAAFRWDNTVTLT